jgi:hypothetical protein
MPPSPPPPSAGEIVAALIAKFETNTLTRLKLLLATASKLSAAIAIATKQFNRGAESMKTIYAIALAAAILISETAGAGTTVTTSSTNCRRSAYGPATCTTTTTKNDDADQANSTPKEKSAAQARREQQEADARDRQWEAYCKPTGVVDKFGITRLQYAHQGCEFGISEDTGSFAQMK